MKIIILTIGKGQPRWIEEGFNEYAKRMPRDFELQLIEIAAIKRGDNDNLDKIKTQESTKLLEKIPTNAKLIALDPQGKKLSTEDMAKQLDRFYQAHQDIAFAIGGPEGLDQTLLQKATHCWSLSELTFPHALVRVIMAEQIYRAMTILKKLPYHR